MKTLLVIFNIFFSIFIFGQENIDYLNEGNNLLNQNKPEEAEKVFKKGLEKEPENKILKSQIALVQMNQNKNDEAQKTLNEILKIDSTDVATLWYSGVNNFTNKTPKFRDAIKFFEKAYPNINKNSPQFFAINYFIGNSYRKLLYSEGLSYDEVSRMLETLKIYTELQPNAEDYETTKKFIEKIETNRMPKNVKKWVITTEENADKIIKENLK